MTSFIAAGGSGRSASIIPAVPAAWSVTTIAFIRHLTPCQVLAVSRRLRDFCIVATHLSPLDGPDCVGLSAVHPELPTTGRRRTRVLKVVGPAPAELAVAQTRNASENRRDPPPRPTDRIFDLRKRPRS